METQEKPFSSTLRGLLHFSKRHEEPFTFKSLQKHLGVDYHPDMRLKDVLTVINNALLEMLQFPEFQVGNKERIQFEILIAPISGLVPLSKNECLSMFGPGLDDEFSIEQFYDKIISEYMHKFMFTNIGWCRDYVFPEEKDKVE